MELMKNTQKRIPIWPESEWIARHECHGPCSQGRNECPTPQACYLEEELNKRDPLVMLALLLACISLVALIWAVLA